MHNLILGCLLDMCENPKTIAHINAWRGKSDVTAAHLFCEIWRSEERDMGVQRDHTGSMTGLVLTNKDQQINILQRSLFQTSTSLWLERIRPAWS